MRLWQCTRTLCCVICRTYCGYNEQPGHPDACWMTVHFWVCIYLPLVTGGNVWEVRSAKPNSAADTHIHTLPLTLGQRSSHTTHRPLPLVCPTPPCIHPHQSAPGSLTFPTLYRHFPAFLPFFPDIYDLTSLPVFYFLSQFLYLWFLDIFRKI